MTRKRLIDLIEAEGVYDRVRVNYGRVTAHEIGTPDRYRADSNSGGRRLLGYDTELTAALIESGSVEAE